MEINVNGNLVATDIFRLHRSSRDQKEPSCSGWYTRGVWDILLYRAARP